MPAEFAGMLLEIVENRLFGETLKCRAWGSGVL